MTAKQNTKILRFCICWYANTQIIELKEAKNEIIKYNVGECANKSTNQHIKWWDKHINVYVSDARETIKENTRLAEIRYKLLSIKNANQVENLIWLTFGARQYFSRSFCLISTSTKRCAKNNQHSFDRTIEYRNESGALQLITHSQAFEYI